jgi:hypothetical protein
MNKAIIQTQGIWFENETWNIWENFLNSSIEQEHF